MGMNTKFPNIKGQYAHCPFCGTCEGQGLSGERGYQFVVCAVCGARGPTVQIHGDVDIAARDHEARQAWNVRAGSDGRPEIEQMILDAIHVWRGRLLKSPRRKTYQRPRGTGQTIKIRVNNDGVGSLRSLWLYWLPQPRHAEPTAGLNDVLLFPHVMTAPIPPVDA